MFPPITFRVVGLVGRAVKSSKHSKTIALISLESNEETLKFKLVPALTEYVYPPNEFNPSFTPATFIPEQIDPP